MNMIYYNTLNPASFGGEEKLKKAYGKPVAEWLSNQRSYTLHKPIKRNFSRRIYRAKYVNQFWQADLNEMIPFSRENGGNKYILTVVDVLSRYAMALPLQNKTGNSIKLALIRLFSENGFPSYLHTDEGKEFYNKNVSELLKKENIKLYSVRNKIKAGIVERFNRTLKTKMYRYFTFTGKRRWIDELPNFLKAYNNSYHRTLKCSPNEAKRNPERTFKMQQNRTVSGIKKKIKYKKGDYVRLSRWKKVFEKGFTPNWSEEIFKIESVDTKYYPHMYALMDLQENSLPERFYVSELQKVSKPKSFAIEKVLKKKGNKSYIKFLGYDEPEWIDTKNINNILMF